MLHVHDMIIIGGGPAGYTAALYAARAGLDVRLIEKMSVGGQMALTGEIENYPGFDEPIDGFTLGEKMKSGAEKYGAVTEYAEVIGLKLEENPKRVITADKEYLTKTVVIATGAEPRELGIAKERELSGRGVHYCAHCDGRFYKEKTVAVVGGGNSAVSDALYLSRFAKKVYLIHRRDTLRATKIYHSPLKDAENIEILFDSVLTDLTAEIRLKSITVSNTLTKVAREIECDGVFISIGRRPSSELVKDILLLDDNGYIIAGEDTKTSLDGVYAAGDVRTKSLRQIVTAAADGATASHHAEEYISLTP